MSGHGKINKKQLAARILCTLLLGTYLTGGYSGPVQAAGSVNGNEHVEITGSYASAWGYGDTNHPVKATGDYSTAFGVGTEAGGEGSTAFGAYSRAVVFNSTAWGYATQAGQLLYGSNNTAADIVSYVEGGTTKYKIVDAKNPDTVLKGGFSSYYSAYRDDDLQHKGNGATVFGYRTTASGDNSTAFGYESKASGDNSMAFGKSSNAKADNSLAALGGYVDESAKNSAAIGNGAKVTVADAVALGSGSVADTANTISVGSSSLQRKIVNVAAGTADTDAVNFQQLKETNATLGTVANAVESLNALTAGFPEGKTIKNYVDDSITVVNGEISDLKTGKLDKAEYEADKATTQAALNGKANVALDNITEDGKTVVRDLAKESVKIVAGTKTTVTEGTDGNAKTYAVDVVTNGAVASGDTGIVTGGTVYDHLNKESLELGAKSTKIAIGKGSKATGNNSIAIGFGNKVSGKNSGAFGDPNDVSGSGSYAFGNNNTVSGDNTFVLGNNVKTSAKNAVVLGDGSEGVDDAVSVGSKDKKRQIKNVADGTEDSDAATYGQLKALAGGAGAGLEEVTRRISDVDSKVNKVGAGAAALAALHPMDTDGTVRLRVLATTGMQTPWRWGFSTVRRIR